MRHILVRENMALGGYHKRPTDVMISGKASEAMYAYFGQQYGGAAVAVNRRFEKAERYMVREMFKKEIIKLENRRAQETSPAQAGLYKDSKIPALKAARDKIPSDNIFVARAKYAMEIRFGTIAILGAVMIGSHVGITIPGIEINTSAVFGFSLMLAGLAAFISSLQHRISALSVSNPVRRFFEHAPRLEIDDRGNIYIVKGIARTQKSQGILTMNKATPGPLEQIGDVLLAVLSIPIRLLATQGTRLFGNQSAISIYDTTGTFCRNIVRMIHGDVIAAVQTLAAATSMLMFNDVTILNMYMGKVEEALRTGREAHFKIIQREIDEDLKGNGNVTLINLGRNLFQTNTGKRLNRVLEATLFSRLTRKLVERVIAAHGDGRIHAVVSERFSGTASKGSD